MVLFYRLWTSTLVEEGNEEELYLYLTSPEKGWWWTKHGLSSYLKNIQEVSQKYKLMLRFLFTVSVDFN